MTAKGNGGRSAIDPGEVSERQRSMSGRFAEFRGRL